MERLSDNLFAGAAFTENQHGQIGRRESLDRRAKSDDGRTFTDNLHSLRHLLGEVLDATHHLFPLARVFQRTGRGYAELREGFGVFIRKRSLDAVEHFETRRSNFRRRRATAGTVNCEW